MRTGNLAKFNQALDQFGEKFQTDGTYTLIIRLRHNVIKTGEFCSSISAAIRYEQTARVLTRFSSGCFQTLTYWKRFLVVIENHFINVNKNGFCRRSFEYEWLSFIRVCKKLPEDLSRPTGVRVFTRLKTRQGQFCMNIYIFRFVSLESSLKGFSTVELK